MPEKNKNSQNKINLRAITVGVVVGVIAISITLAVFAQFITMFFLPEFFVGMMSLLTVTIGSFIGGFFGGKTAKENGIMVGAFVGIALSIIILIGGMAIISQSVSVVYIIKFFLVMVFSIAGGVFGVNSKGIKRR